MLKQKSNKEKERENTRGKRRYIERLAETKEADKQIKEFDRGDSVFLKLKELIKGLNE